MRRRQHLALIASGLLGLVALPVLDVPASRSERPPAGDGPGSAGREPPHVPAASGPSRASPATPGDPAARAPVRSTSVGAAREVARPAEAVAGAEVRGVAAPDPGRPGSSAGAPQLDAIVADPGALTVRVTGVDPRAPRLLDLWHVREDPVRRMTLGGPVEIRHAVGLAARGWSDSSGEIHFPPVPVAPGSVRFAAAPEGVHPLAAPASPLQGVTRPAPEPPGFEVLEQGGGEVRLRVSPREPGGRVVVADSALEPHAVEALPAGPGPRPLVFEVDLALGPRAHSLFLAQERPDGQRSSWARVALDLDSKEEKP